MIKKKVSVLLFFILSMLFLGCNQQADLYNIERLCCEYVKEPKGIDMQNPRFSWVLSSHERGISQAAYSIIVADSREILQRGDGNLWNSGKVASPKTTNIVYEGKPLQSSKQYFWKVQVWDETGDKGRWSEISSFYTGIIDNSQWKAQWISAADTNISAPLLRKNFALEGEIKKAIVHVTGVGYYAFYLNGKKVEDHVLDPAITDYSRRILYATYDVKDMLMSGANVAGLMIGNGAYRMIKSEERYSWWSDNVYGIPCGLMQLEVTFTDGSQQTIVSDGSWTYSSGPFTYNHIFGGEDYDARLEKEGWAAPGYKADGWDNVMIVDGPGGMLDAQLMAPMKVTETMLPKAEINPEPAVYMYDMEQNFAGWWRIKVKGKAGATIKVRAAETLNDSLFPEPLTKGDRISTKHRYHEKVFTTYTLKGGKTEVYEPRFFYTGYRYLEVKTDDPDAIETLSVEGRVVHSALQRNGSFATSDTLINNIYKAAIWSQRGNLHGYPTDCPQREKGAYTGDGQVIAEASMHDFHMAALYYKWLNDMKDAQEENGRIPNTSPELVGGHGGGIAWGSAYVLLPWWMYHYYDDTRVLEEHYQSMKKYIQYLYDLARTDANPAEKYIINDFGTYWYSLGEWCAPGQGDCPNHPVVNTAYYYKDVSLLSYIADVLGEQEDAVQYRQLSDSIKDAFNAKFFNEETKLYGTEEIFQTYQVLALSFDLVEEKNKDAVLQTVIDDIVINRNGHLNTGILGTKYLWPVLVNAKRADLAYQIVKKTTYPSYGYWLENGATTLWEKWSGKSSHNHQMFGSVNEFFYKYLAGIRPPMDSGIAHGYQHIVIKPVVPEGLQHVNASLETVSGKVLSGWQKQDASFSLTVTVPANSTGTIYLPLLNTKTPFVQESGKTIWEEGTFKEGIADGVLGGKKNEKHLVFSVESGTYRFSLALK
jgi:alpha-L-rhamnosidase